MRLWARWRSRIATRDFPAPASRRTRRLKLCQLEERTSPTDVFRSIDGSGNNLAHPTWGSAGVDLLRIAPP